MLNWVCDWSAVFAVELKVARIAIMLQLVLLTFFDRDVSAENIWKG